MRAGVLVSIGGILSLALAAPSRAALILVQTPVGATQSSAPVSARATVTTGSNSVTVVLENLTVDPPSAAQCLSGFQFHLSTGQSSGTLLSSSGLERAVASGGSYTDGSPASTGWDLDTVGSDLRLDLLSTSTAPSHEIIGPPDIGGQYTGNASITNGAHNPHIGLSATFTLTVPGVTAATTVSSALFQFNTSYGNTTTGMVTVPEPTALSALALAAGSGLLSRRQRTRTAEAD